MRRAFVATVLAGSLATGLAACNVDASAAPSSAAPSASAAAAADSASASAAGATAAPPSVPSGGPPSSGSPTAGVSGGLGTVPNPALFEAAFGGEVAGLTFRFDPDTTATIAADPRLALDVAELGMGLYTVTGQQPIEDFGIVSVLRLRDPARDDEWFRSYRDSYDGSACEQAGGVVRHAESEIGGHTVFIGSCAGGAFTYHLRTADGLVVSITGVGPKRVGETLAAAVKAP